MLDTAKVKEVFAKLPEMDQHILMGKYGAGELSEQAQRIDSLIQKLPEEQRGEVVGAAPMKKEEEAAPNLDPQAPTQ